MKAKSSILAGLAVLLTGTAGADAADLYGGSIKDGAYARPALANPARIYLRGDYTYASQGLGGIAEVPSYELSQTSLGNTHAYGAGIGVYVSPSVRLDFTYDWRGRADLRGNVIDGAATVEGTRKFGVKSDVALFNVYYDFDSRSRFTPYVGVGLGFARNRTTDGTVDILVRDTDPCIDPTVATCSAGFSGATKWSAAGAVMAGFSAKIHDRLHVDAGYRFLYLGDAHTGDVVITRSPVVDGAPTSSPNLRVSDMHAHEFRVGLRWDIK